VGETHTKEAQKSVSEPILIDHKITTPNKLAAQNLPLPAAGILDLNVD